METISAENRASGADSLRVDRWLIAGLVFFAILLTSSFWKYPGALPATRDPDALKYLSFAHSMVDAVRHFDEYPLWNPYFGGGIPWSGYVCNTGLSLQSLIYILFGEIVGVKIWLVAVLILGGCGMYGVLRNWLQIGRAAAFSGALLYMSSSWYAGVVKSGDYDLHALFALPFAMLCMLWLLRGRRLGLMLPVCFMTWLADAAKWWPFLAAATILAIALVYRKSSGRSLRETVLVWVAALIFGLALTAPKILPLITLLKADLVNQVAQREWICYKNFLDIWHAMVLPKMHRANLNMSIGLAGVLFAASAVVLAFRRSLGLLIILAVAVVISLGRASPFPVVRAMTDLPLLNTMGSYGMYVNLPMLFCTCSLAALGTDCLWRMTQRWSRKRNLFSPKNFVSLLIAVVALANIGHLALYANAVYAKQFTVPGFRAQREPFHHAAYRNHLGRAIRYREPPRNLPEVNQYYNLFKGVGTITWLGNMVFPEYAKAKQVFDDKGSVSRQDGYIDEIYCADLENKNCIADALHVTYNNIFFNVKNLDQSVIVLNMNYDSGWECTEGEIENQNGLLAVKVPSSPLREIRLTYHDDKFVVGLVLAIGAAIVWLACAPKWLNGHRELPPKN